MNQQLDLLPPVDASRAGARHAAMRAAAARADLGMTRAARRAARLHAGWCEKALAELRRIVRSQAGAFTIEQLRLVLPDDFPQPHEKRAWGRVVQDAVRLGYLRKTGRMAPAASSNGSGKALWTRGAKA